jgi:hypothetical protein
VNPLLPALAKAAIIGQEQALIDGVMNNFMFEQRGIAVAVGQPLIDGAFPVATVADGAAVALGFGFVDPNTAATTSNGPLVSSVLYEASTDPTTPNALTLIGVSSDAADGFAVSYTLTSFEAAIFAVPMDASGDPIVIAGVDGQNVAVGEAATVAPVPEPSSLVMAGPVLVLLARAGIVRSRGRT